MRCLSVDPGKFAGWCLRTKYGVEEHGECNGSLVGDVDDVVTRAFYARPDPLLCVIEEQTPNRVSGWKARNTLIRRAEIWAVLAERLGVRVVRVAPSVWQAHLKIKGTHDQRMVGLRALLMALDYHVGDMTDDECCACGIDLWAYATLRVGA